MVLYSFYGIFRCMKATINTVTGYWLVSRIDDG